MLTDIFGKNSDISTELHRFGIWGLEKVICDFHHFWAGNGIRLRQYFLKFYSDILIGASVISWEVEESE